MAEALTQMGNELANVRQDLASMQDTIDSLRVVLAKQDTVIGHLATLAGVPR